MSENTSYKFTRGSIWRKWDLQVQTRLDNNYGCLGNSLDNENLQKLMSITQLTKAEITAQEKLISAEKYAKLFINYVTLFTDISVIGITDHNTGKELDYLIAESKHTNGRLTIIPGVEIASSHGIHILCLFDPEKPWKTNWAESIDHFMTEIGLTGNVFNVNGQPNSAKKTSQEIMEIVEKKGGVCIFAHINTENGLFYRRSNTASGGTAHKDIYTHRLCQIVQIPHSGTVSEGTQRIIDGKDENYNYKRVTKTQCSDARKLSEIGVHYSWIKADPTFDGLKQIIFEPNERIKNQKQNPYEDKHKIYFDSLNLSGSKNFILSDLKISFNRELVAIIGGRGSGKSALLDTFAFFNEEHLKSDQNNKPKIIEYYRDNRGNTDPRPSFTLETILVSKDGDQFKYKKPLNSKEIFELPFLYLGQERLSNIATNDSELTQVVCDLIGIDINELNQEDLKLQAMNILSSVSNTRNRIEDIVKRYIKLGCFDEKKLEQWAAGYLSKLIDQQKKLSSNTTKEIVGEINKITERGLKLNKLREQTTTLLSNLNNLEINKTIDDFNSSLEKVYDDYEKIENIDVSKQVQTLNTLQQKIDRDTEELRTKFIDLKTTLKNQGIKEDVNTLLQASEHLQIQISNIKKDIESYKKFKQQLVDLHIEKNKITNQIKLLLTNLKNNIIMGFKKFQNSRDNSIKEEKELFEKIIEGIEIDGKIEFNFKKFTKHVLDNYIDNRKISNETDLKEMIAGRNEDGTPKGVTFDILVQWIQTTDLSGLKCFTKDGINGLIKYIFTEWTDFFSVKAVAKLKGKATEILSIGQRGTLLLKVYLATATAKQVLVIDQPEDNLDNNFIMNELVPLIRKAKQSRQIIMSTHNANLVVNADAEQIIVARLDQDLNYFSGSIENSKINKDIRDILEGGEEAFRQREKKYFLTK